MHLDKEERKMYENGLKRIRDYIAEMKTAEIRDIDKGIQKEIAYSFRNPQPNYLATKLKNSIYFGYLLHKLNLWINK